MQIESFGQTHVGKVRQNNEDAFIVSDKLKLYAVADGIGSLSHGELASKLAVNLLKMAAEAKRLTGLENICLAGGVALNCVANGKLFKEKIIFCFY